MEKTLTEWPTRIGTHLEKIRRRLYQTPTCCKEQHFYVAGRQLTWCRTATSCQQQHRKSCQRWSRQARTRRLHIFPSNHCWRQQGKFPPHSSFICLFPQKCQNTHEFMLSLSALGQQTEIKAVKNMNISCITSICTETASQPTVTEWDIIATWLQEEGSLCPACVAGHRRKTVKCAEEREPSWPKFVTGEEGGNGDLACGP